ncbi:MAG: ABC transporter permease [Marinilabiliales bacterium]|nr:MAG: ABC transporter permease [Marinilabiliales bacterium]
MNIELHIAKRLAGDQDGKKTISGPIVKIAVAGIALGMAVMLISVAVVTGFKREIRNKVIGFGSHIQITNFDSNISWETTPVRMDQDFLPGIAQIPEVRHIQPFATKPGIIRTRGEDIQGVILKGVDGSFDWSFFEQNMVEGSRLTLTDTVTSNEAVLSRTVASLLRLDVGDDFAMFFVQEPPRARRFTLSGIYDTGLEELDKMFVLADLRHIQRLNDWDDDQVSGFEILLHDYDNIDLVARQVDDLAGYQFTGDLTRLRVESINDKYPQFFDWLELLDMNVWVILSLMVIVAGFNMVSGLLILILERTGMIGILKAMGLENSRLRKIFLYQSAFLTAKGLFWGNLIGIGLILVQHYTGFLKLDQASYFIPTVPVNLRLLHVLLLNAGTMAVTVAMLVIPSYIIGRIDPEKTIRFD